MALELLPGERQLHRSNANMVIVPSQYGLSQFAAGRLLGLMGMEGKEAIGGRVHITSARLAFAAHPINRLGGVFSVPLPQITHAARLRSGVTLGFEIVTRAAGVRFVSWSRRAALAALDQARGEFGEAERALLLRHAVPDSDLVIRPAAEGLNQAAAALFKWGRHG